jgi:peptidoglycan/xylan/chitin deacetylase (PgdA/CDA1 family)
MLAAVLVPLLGLLAVSTISVYLQPRFIIDLVSRAYPEVVFTVKTEEKIIALTIDDAPTYRETPILLDILRDNGAKATFFCIGYNIIHEDPTREILTRMKDEGHELGNHMFYDSASYQLSDTEFTQQLVDVDALLEEVKNNNTTPSTDGDSANTTNGSLVPTKPTCSNNNNTGTTPTKWFRPGHGFFTRKMVELACEYGYKTALGDCYPHDPAIALPSVNTYYILNRVHPGAIVILHNRPWTLETLSSVIPQLKSMGYTITTLTELSKYDTSRRTRQLAIENKPEK